MRLRKPPAPWAMSTLEAIAMALQQIESIELGEHIFALHERFVLASRAQRGLHSP
jgi:DTW domain-containing protein YfiP